MSQICLQVNRWFANRRRKVTKHRKILSCASPSQRERKEENAGAEEKIRVWMHFFCRCQFRNEREPSQHFVQQTVVQQNALISQYNPILTNFPSGQRGRVHRSDHRRDTKEEKGRGGHWYGISLFSGFHFPVYILHSLHLSPVH